MFSDPTGVGNRAPQKFPQVVWALFLIQMSNWRWSWPQMLLTGMLGPMATMGALGLFARNSGPQAVQYVLAGSITMALLFETQNKVASNFAFMKTTGAFDFYASLPVRREALIIGTVGAFTVLALPAVVCTSLFGIFVLDVPISPSPLFLPVLAFVVLPFAGLGAWVGSRSSTIDEASSVSLGITMAMIAVGPVTIPEQLLPRFLVWLGHLNPATYASSLLRQVLIGEIAPRAALDVVVLVVFSAGVWTLTRYRTKWRAA
ncbi:ABC transporter [Lentzea guizhouensis]|uniref:Transport permease protein n=1 Tax=Lentzea guizhouensis TaxID=1586287 RepID=A0A1B2HPT6_9PSEU|nr:ABC transporter permease [Lentzea guizhouensis]ANZ39736.1 ABC transporter [Lentzea guizhouensis]